MDYALYENKLTDEPDDFIARMVNATTKSRENLVGDVTGPGSILKETECNAVLNDYWKKIIDYVGEGALYRDDHIGVRIDMVGVFMGEDDHFAPDRHQLKRSITPSGMLKEALASVPLKKVKAEKTLPEIDEVYDWGSNTTNQKLTPNDTLEIKGDNFKIYADQEEQGVYFINTDDGTKIKATVIRTNEPKTLSLRVPTLATGNYRLEVRNAIWKSKTIRVGLTTTVFTVG